MMDVEIHLPLRRFWVTTGFVNYKTHGIFWQGEQERNITSIETSVSSTLRRCSSAGTLKTAMIMDQKSV